MVRVIIFNNQIDARVRSICETKSISLTHFFSYFSPDGAGEKWISLSCSARLSGAVNFLFILSAAA